MKHLRVLIAEDYKPLLQEICILVASAHEVVGTSNDGQNLIDDAAKLRPDLILLDINLPHVKGLQAGKRLKQILPETLLIFVTQHSSPEYIQAAFRAGAHGYLLKQAIRTELLPAIEQAAIHRYFVSPKLLSQQIASRFNPVINPSELFGAGLTSLQESILIALQKGRRGDEIASHLGVSRSTVQAEIDNLLVEWNAHAVEQLVAYAVSTDLLPSDPEI